MQQSAAHFLASAVAVAVAVACLALSPSAHAQGTSGSGSGAMPSCAAKLVPCAGYLNSTSTAAADCCGPLREAAANETGCLCAMLLNRAALRAFGVAPEQGLILARRCNVTTDAAACTGGTASSGSTATSSASTGSAATSSSSVTKPTANGGSVAGRLSLTGASSMVGFSFIWLTIMA